MKLSLTSCRGAPKMVPFWMRSRCTRGFCGDTDTGMIGWRCGSGQSLMRMLSPAVRAVHSPAPLCTNRVTRSTPG